MPFESCLPVRRFPSYKGQCHYIGQWWTATTGTLVGFESWLERDRLMLLDFDPDTVGLASQPYWLFWTTAEGRSRSHAPDYFARLADGTAIVLDCCPLDRFKPKDEVAFEATRAACELLGWRYEIVGTPPEVLLANVRWLAGYRHPRHDLHVVVQTLRGVLAADAAAGWRRGGGRADRGAAGAVSPALASVAGRGPIHTSDCRD
ncbi:TnsA-like heteromeric transposase endonuclease subunit [Lentzea sp. NPDC051213]|uniref:TnsA-like heteromeric transposase endonuclease subunit n=1 Tax=Lentzea sp. NPDC051213 TaxID=3364126 RepID=UPI00378FDF8F